MGLITRLDRIMADRKMSVNELAERIGIVPTNISRIRAEKINAIRLSTMEGNCDYANYL